MNKEELRKKFKSLRERLSDLEWREKSSKICEIFLNSLYFTMAKRIAFYHFIDKEVDLTLAIEEALKSHEVYLPKTHPLEKKLTFHRIFSLEELSSGYMGIPEPPFENPEIHPEELEVILVPGLAFDMERIRLGYGGGYYDRFLKKTKALKIGIAFSLQIVDSLPKELYDEKMDLLLTEEGFF